MKIGEFSRLCGVSRDTIRFYIKNNLLIPNDHGTQYEFTEKEYQEMQIIFRMKSQRFTLEEIGRYLMLLRANVMFGPESLEYASQLLNQKKQSLQKEIEDLNSICRSIDTDLQNLQRDSIGHRQMTGVPLRALALLACPHCRKTLQISNANLDMKYVYSGDLICSCGYHITIENGIVKTGNVYTGNHDRPDLQRGFYIKVSNEFAAYTQKSGNYIMEALSSSSLADKVIYEGYCNGFFFLYNHLKELDSKAIFIFTDKYPEMMELYKANIERMDLKLDILYIADNSIYLPLRFQCIDIMLDFMNSNEHSLYFKTPYIQDIRPFLKSGANIYGHHFSYPEQSATLKALQKKYPEGSCDAYLFKRWKAAYEQAGVKLCIKELGKVMTTEKSYSFDCHKDGEALNAKYFEGNYYL